MLIHSVWEDILIWGVLQIALLILARKSPQARYLAACVALAAMAVLPWLTFDASDLSARLKASHAVSVNATVAAPLPAMTRPASSDEASRKRSEATSSPLVSPQEAPSPLARALPLLVAMWIAGLVFSSIQLWLRWHKVEALIRQPFQALPRAWSERFAQLVELSGVNQIVRLGETAAVSVPLVAGWLKPVILLPLGVVTSLPAEQIEAILLHELAHISRHDYLVNLLQNVVETLFFYHPAVWAASRRIRLERELACDDQTVAWCKNPRTYAEALAGFEEFRHQSPLLAATGEGDLFARIRRILVGPQPERRGAAIVAAAGFCGMGIYLASMFLVPVLAEQVMTSAERVARIEALQPAPVNRDLSAPREAIYITGTIHTEDDQPLPEDLMKKAGAFPSGEAVLSSHLPNWSENSTLSFDPRDHTFMGTVASGTIGIGIWAQGYAPFQQADLRPVKGRLNLDVELKRGIPGRVRITGPDGQPLAGVVINATSSDAGKWIGLAMPPVTTDAGGTATFGNVEADSAIHLTALKPGWQMINWTVSQWSGPEPAVRVLQPALPTSGVAIDRVTRKPVPGVTIILAGRHGPGSANSMSYDPAAGSVLGHGDGNGHFELTSLNNDFSYRIYIEAPGHAMSSFAIQSGDRNKVFEIPVGLHVHGKILDPEGRLSRLGHPVEIRCDYTIQAMGPESPAQFEFGQSKSHPLSKLGPEIPFAFEDLPKGRVEFFLDRQWYTLDLKKNVDDFIIDLGSKSAPALSPPGTTSTRTIDIAIKTAAGQVAPTGALDIKYLDLDAGPHAYNYKTVPIENGLAEVKLLVPTEVTLSPEEVNGYWLPDETFNVPIGTGPYTHALNAFPAGVIHGAVIADPAMKARPFLVQPIILENPPGLENPNLRFAGHASQTLSDHYVTTSLPLGGTYAAVLYSSPSYFVSPPALVDDEHPLVVRDMNLVAKDSITGKLVDENNQPLGFQQVSLTYHPTEHMAFSGEGTMTGRDGTFTIDRMNLNVPGNYELQLSSDTWERTTIRIDRHTPQPVLITLHHRLK